MQRLLRCVLFVALLVGGACGEDMLGPDSNEVGTYELESVDGRAPPTPFFAVEVVSATIVIREDRSYQVTSTVRAKDNLGELITQTSVRSGTYTRTDNTLHLTNTLGVVSVAEYSGRTLTVDAQGIAMVYRRKLSS